MFKLITSYEARESEFRTSERIHCRESYHGKRRAYVSKSKSCVTRDVKNQFCRNNHVVAWASPPTSLRIIWIVWMYQPSTSHLHMYLTHTGRSFSSPLIIYVRLIDLFPLVSVSFFFPLPLLFFFHFFPLTRLVYANSYAFTLTWRIAFFPGFVDENDEHSFDLAERDVQRKMIHTVRHC